MGLNGIVFIILFLQGISATSTNEKVIRKHDAVTLKCPLSPSLPVFWLLPEEENFVHYNIGRDIEKKFENNSNFKLLHDYALQIKDVTEDKLGKYKCRQIEKNSTSESVFLLKLLEKPEVYQTGIDLTFKTQVNKLTPISLDVRSLFTPTISWSETSGDTVGIWNVAKIDTENYTISSTIVPKSESNFGQYGITVRNDAGSSRVVIKLIQDDWLVVVSPTRIYCNLTIEVVVSCLIYVNNPSKWMNIWIHSRNGQQIKQVDGKINGNESTITLKFCDFKEEGSYTCIWQKENTRLSGNSSVHVVGSPVITATKVRLKSSNICMEIQLYAYNQPAEANWYTDDTMIQNSSMYAVTLTVSTIDLTYSNKTVHAIGYITRLCILDLNMTLMQDYTSRIFGDFGGKEVTFDEQRLKKAYNTLKPATNTTLNDSTVGSNNIPITTNSFERLRFLYWLIPLVCLITIITCLILTVQYRRTKNGRVAPSNNRKRVTTLSTTESHFYDEIPADSKSLQNNANEQTIGLKESGFFQLRRLLNTEEQKDPY